MTLVEYATKLGILKQIKTLTCACGRPARFYDHRDYRKPLEVTAVCGRCNYRLGPAKFDDGPPLLSRKRGRLGKSMQNYVDAETYLRDNPDSPSGGQPPQT